MCKEKKSTNQKTTTIIYGMHERKLNNSLQSNNLAVLLVLAIKLLEFNICIRNYAQSLGKLILKIFSKQVKVFRH